MELEIIPEKSESFAHSADVICALGYQETGEKIGESNIVRHSVSKKLYTQYSVHLSRKEELGEIRKLKNPHVLQVIDICKSDERVFVISEYVSTRSLFLEIIIKGRLNREVALNYFAQVCAGINFLHSKGVVHGNLRAENTIIDKDGKIKITEYGIHNQSCATHDIKSLGTLLQQMLFGCSYTFSQFITEFSYEMREFIKSLIEGNSFKDVQEILGHKLMEPYKINSFDKYEESRRSLVIYKLERYLDSKRKSKIGRFTTRSEMMTNVSDTIYQNSEKFSRESNEQIIG